MKKLLLFIFSLTFSLQVFAQWDMFLDFENGTDSIITIDTIIMPNNQWQIGTPSKTYFDSAYSPTHAIMTDTINPYYGPSVSRAEIKLGSEQGGWQCMSANVSFYNKFDTDSLVDGCSLEFSYDGGLSFINIFTYASTGQGYVTHQNIDNGQYLYDDTLPNNKIGLSGNSNGWIFSEIYVWDNNCLWQTDTLIFHFVFRANSDNIDTLQGWIIDDIYMSAAISEGLSKYKLAFSSTLYPNPTTNSATIEFKNLQNASFNLQVFDITGRAVIEQNNIRTNRAQFNTKNLSPGIYHYRLLSEKEQKMSSGKFVVE